MSASITRLLHQPERFGRLWWLPSGGEGNGLSDDAWVPIGEFDGAAVRLLLAELRAAGVPAYVAPVARRPRERLRGRRGGAAEQRAALWVGCSAYGRAEEMLRTKLSAILTRAQP
jgi:hypothetical protein